MTISKDSWLIRFIHTNPADFIFKNRLRPDAKVYTKSKISLCALFWKTLGYLFINIMIPVAILSVTGIGIYNWKTTLLLMAFISFMVGCGVLDSRRKERKKLIEAGLRRPPTPGRVKTFFKTVFWGIKNRVCPLITIQGSEPQTDSW